MKIIRSKSFTATRAWGALDIANMGGITTRLHWTDQPYKWHVNDGEEVFAVLDGRVEMRYREGGVEQSAILETGDVFYASVGHRTCRASARRGAHSGGRGGGQRLTSSRRDTVTRLRVRGAHGSIMDQRRGARAGGTANASG